MQAAVLEGSTACNFERLPDRTAVFVKATGLLLGAKKIVLDTTWGNSEINLTESEINSRQRYEHEKQRAISDGKFSYREIYTDSPADPHRVTRIESERNRTGPAKTYSAKLLGGIDPTFPMIDFLVVDGAKVILSCLSKDTAQPGHHYLYADSTDLAKFLTVYFQICWDLANIPKQS